MNHVTFETAKRLEATGFPKSKVEIGQAWYNFDGFAFFISLADYKDSTGVEYVTGLDLDGKTGASFHPDQARLACTFAPTATDILPHLSANWNLSSFILPSGKVQYACVWNYERDEPADPDKEFYHENSAECAAMAWLQIHENK